MGAPLDSAVIACGKGDFDSIYRVINESSKAYRGVIPDDCWREPYMSEDELRAELEAGVTFLGYVSDRMITGVMGSQNVRDVTLIRHAYVLPSSQRKGIGGLLLRRLLALTERPVLVGTWAAASWAVRFYEKRGFGLIADRRETLLLLRKYWTVSPRQMRASVVLANKRWFEKNPT